MISVSSTSLSIDPVLPNLNFSNGFALGRSGACNYCHLDTSARILAPLPPLPPRQATHVMAQHLYASNLPRLSVPSKCSSTNYGGVPRQGHLRLSVGSHTPHLPRGLNTTFLILSQRISHITVSYYFNCNPPSQLPPSRTLLRRPSALIFRSPRNFPSAASKVETSPYPSTRHLRRLPFYRQQFTAPLYVISKRISTPSLHRRFFRALFAFHTHTQVLY